MEELSKKRFVRALRVAQELLIGEAKCYRYEHDPDFLEVVEDLKFAIRMLEESEEFAGKLLFKNARRFGYSHWLNLARRAKTEEERNFFAYLSDMNMQREQRALIERQYDSALAEYRANPVTYSLEDVESILAEEVGP